MAGEALGFVSPKPMQTRAYGSVGSAGGESPLPGVIPPPRLDGAEVNVETALSISAVYRAVSILSTSVSQLELGVWRGINELRSVPTLVSRPDVNISPSKFLAQTTTSLASTGNAYWRLFRESPADPVQNVQVLNPLSMHINYDKDGNKTFEYGGYSKPMVFKPWQIRHLTLLQIPGTDYGLGPIQACRLELRGSLDLRGYAGNWFSDGAVPTGVLTSASALTSTEADMYRQRWIETQQTRGVAVLGQGLSYEPILLSPADAQFLESQSFSKTGIATMFGLPANYLLAEVNGNVMTYQNLQDVDVSFVRQTLMQYLREIEEAFSEMLPRGQKARFKLEGLLRAHEKTRFETYKTALEAGFLTVDEVRAMEHLPPLTTNEEPS